MESLLFSKPSEDELHDLARKIFPERSDQDQLQDYLAKDQFRKLWMLNTKGEIDPARPPRARFAYLIGKPWVNIAEIIILTEETSKRLNKIGLEEASSKCFIARVASNYELNELPLKTLDEAVAGELVFSLWTRRRDAHNDNHSYTYDGLPVCYDFELAFLAENEGRKFSEFFGRNELGYAGRWRVRELTDNNQIVITEYARQYGDDGKDSCIHLIHSMDRFKSSCRNIATLIRENSRDVRQIAEGVGMARPELEKVVSFLRESKESLQDDVERMLKIVIPKGR